MVHSANYPATENALPKRHDYILLVIYFPRQADTTED